MFIVVNSLNNEKISINPIHIVSVIVCGIEEPGSSIITTIVEKYYVKETVQAVSDLVNGKSADAAQNITPKIGDSYFYYDIMNDLKKASVFVNEEPHISRVNVGNCFKTLEEVNFDFIKLQLGEGGRLK